jgi:hypothetical protein
MPVDYNIRDHKAWLGYIQPDGLVVSPAALVDAQVLLDRNTLPLQERFLPFVEEAEHDGDAPVTTIKDFARFAREFLEWPDDCLYGLDGNRPLPESLFVSLSNFGETIAPSFAFKDLRPKDTERPWLLLVQTLPLGTDLDARQSRNDSDWNASPSQRFERLLRETGVSIGLLSNGERVRLIYAPRGENSGSATFVVREMTEVAGRSILAAFHMLLDRYRLLAAPSEARLPALLARSRDYQSRVSATLAQQVLDALYELLRGFQGANERAKGELLYSVIESHPDDVYSGLLTVLMRMVFLLFAEDRGLMPTSELYVRHYSVHGLFERLRADNEQYPDTMDHRFGAWAQLLTLFRVVYQGCKHPQMHMPARHGHLFDPARFPFLEGQSLAEPHLPLVSDGTVFRVFEKLFILDGERLSYRTLDVEEIGSVYQTVMGFRLEVVTAPSIAITGKRKHKGEVAAPTVINLSELLATNGNKRKEWLKLRTDQEVSGEAERALKSATTLDDLMAALDRKIARNATPQIVPQGAAVLQPTDERRRSGSHYTPRSFTEPIVRTTLRPTLERLGEHPTPEQILDLKICDLAVGSAAFLVETCRQLGDALVAAWQHHGNRPSLPDDETEELLARRLVAQRCLYGVDRNPMAVDLAKLSLWLATLAKDHPFTFLDHSIRRGDSLVGLTRRQIADFHWLPVRERVLGQDVIEKRIQSASSYRKQILDAGDLISPLLKREKLELADEALNLVREAGDLVIAAYFSAEKDRLRREKRDELLARFTESLRDMTVSFKDEVESLRRGRFPVTPFHWEIEFPEVFDRGNPGFDAIVGNPPFLGGRNITSALGKLYNDAICKFYESPGTSADLCSYFFRRAWNLTRYSGEFGCVAVETIGSGPTGDNGLARIVSEGGSIKRAVTDAAWPDNPNRRVAVVHVVKGAVSCVELNGRKVERITPSLLPSSGDDFQPSRLKANEDRAFQGITVFGEGFILTQDEAEQICRDDPRSREVLTPYLTGQELNRMPQPQSTHHVIDFRDRTEAEASLYRACFQRLESTVKIRRQSITSRKDVNEKWWRLQRVSPELEAAAARCSRVICRTRYGAIHALCFVEKVGLFSDGVLVFAFDSFDVFALLQSNVHYIWAEKYGSRRGGGLRYRIKSSFDTFPFPSHTNSLAIVGEQYYNERFLIMSAHEEGLTDTYNRFHDPDERHPDILRLRELHAAMDRAVLEAYGWNDIAAQARCEFLLDYEDEEDDSNGPRRRKKPWRYRWPDEIRDEVLARLLALNAERAREEQLSGEAAAAQEAKSAVRKSRKKSSTKSAPNNQIGLGFEES